MDQKNDYSFSITETATNELRLILEYFSICLDRPDIADNILDFIYKKIKDIKIFPYSYPSYSNKWVIRGEFRKASANNFLIIYQVDELKKEVIIHGIIHSKINK